MANQLYQQMMQNHLSQNSNVGAIKQMANMLKSNSNPMQMLQMMAGQNPQVAQVMNMISGSGMSAKQLFNQVAQQQGVNTNTIINMLK